MDKREKGAKRGSPGSCGARVQVRILARQKLTCHIGAIVDVTND